MAQPTSFRTLANPNVIMTDTQKHMVSRMRDQLHTQQASKEARRKIVEMKRHQRLDMPGTPQQISQSPLSSLASTPVSRKSHHSRRRYRHKRAPYSPIEPNYKHRHRSECPSSPMSHASSERTYHHQRDTESSEDPLYENELNARLREMNHDNPIGTKSTTVREREMEYWRKKVSLEEEVAIKQAGMALSLLSNVIETVCNATGFKKIDMRGLSSHLDKALRTGAFDTAIKSYCASPSTVKLLQNPLSSFATSFVYVILQTHLDNVSTVSQSAPEPPPPPPARSSSQTPFPSAPPSIPAWSSSQTPFPSAPPSIPARSSSQTSFPSAPPSIPARSSSQTSFPSAPPPSRACTTTTTTTTTATTTPTSSISVPQPSTIIDPITKEERPIFVCPHSTEPPIGNMLNQHMETLRPVLSGASTLLGSYELSNLQQELADLDAVRK